MSYKVYRHWKQATEYYEEYENGSNEDYLEDKIFENIKTCFNIIYEVAKFNKQLYFNLKENWALLRNHDYSQVIENIKEWLEKADDRFDGETWTEKVQVKKPTGELITGEENLKKYVEIITGNIGIIEHENGVNYISEIDLEIDDEDYDRIYVDTPNYVDYESYAQGLEAAVSAALINGGITNFKFNKRFGEIKFYQLKQKL